MPEKFHALSLPSELVSMLLIAVCTRSTATVGKDTSLPTEKNLITAYPLVAFPI